MKYWKFLQANAPRYMAQARRFYAVALRHVARFSNDLRAWAFSAHGLQPAAVKVVAIAAFAIADFKRRNFWQKIAICFAGILMFDFVLHVLFPASVTAERLAPGYDPKAPPSIYIAATPRQQRNCGRSNVRAQALDDANAFLSNSMTASVARLFPAAGSEMIMKAVAVDNSRYDPQITSQSFEFAAPTPDADVMTVGNYLSDVGKFKNFQFIMMACQADMTIQITWRQNGGGEHTTVDTSQILILIPATGYRNDDQMTLFGVSHAQLLAEQKLSIDTTMQNGN